MQFTTKTTTVDIISYNKTLDKESRTAQSFIQHNIQEYMVKKDFSIFYKLGGNLNSALLNKYSDDFTAKELVVLIFLLNSIKGNMNVIHYNNGVKVLRKDLPDHLGMSVRFISDFLKKLFELNMMAEIKETIRSQKDGKRKQSTRTFLTVSPYLMKNKTKYYDNELLDKHFKELNKDII